ncbi:MULTISPECIES: hypothetical protein [Mycobacterium]|uniref:Uncharacterized protein n=1 Tax=Mycobacterium colombiense TaxID=339268 RepID=A0A329LKY3_9MYCO|nr:MULTISPECIES: hypothetical protein [Mycobacterium]MDM4142173.1 hypothetical protein [Mycobacterium sp. FLAC0960]RAV08419.1 hypothetical protein DQP57_16855 [Mycobacterium colombiense]
MHRPDTIIEIHRERVQDQTAEMFSGDKYTQSVDGTGYSATATLDLTLDRVWFVLDARARLWQEEADGEVRDPLRHFAIDLVIFESKIVIDSVTCIPLVSLPPATITIPDGPRAGESREIAYNEIPLFGRLTIHDQLEPHRLEPGKQTIALNFTAQDAPALVAQPLPDRHVGWLFGPHVERREGGVTVFAGQDPRISWELDYAEAYWIHSIAGELMVNLEKLQHPGLSDDEARTRVLDSLAAQIADAVRPQLEAMGDNGIQALLPSPVDVDPEAQDDSTVKDLDAIVQRFDVGTPAMQTTEESMVVQLQTLRELPPGEELPPSVLAENPRERAALAATGWSILRQVRDTVMNSFDLDASDFDPDAPCALAGPKTISIGGQDRSLDALDADIVPRTGDGRLVVDGAVSAETKLYDFNATFKVTYDMGLGDIPRDPKDNELLRKDVDTIELLEETLNLAAQKKRAGHLSAEDYEAEVKRVSERFDRLPRTVGVRPAQNSEPDVNAEFSLTAAGKVATAAGAAAVVGLLALPVTAVAGAAGVGAAGAGGLLTVAIAQYITTVLTIDWFGTGIGSRQVKKSLNDQPEGTSLPPIGMPIAVDLNRQRLAVYFRPVPAKLWIDCVMADADDDQAGDVDGVRVVGGRWPADGHPWRLSHDDAVLFVDADELELFVDPASAGGREVPVGVDTGADGRRRLRAQSDPGLLRGLVHCDERDSP